MLACFIEGVMSTIMDKSLNTQAFFVSIVTEFTLHACNIAAGDHQFCSNTTHAGYTVISWEIMSGSLTVIWKSWSSSQDWMVLWTVMMV